MPWTASLKVMLPVFVAVGVNLWVEPFWLKGLTLVIAGIVSSVLWTSVPLVRR